MNFLQKMFHKHKPIPLVIGHGPDGEEFTKRTVLMTELTFWQCSKCGKKGTEWDNIIHWEK